MNNQQKTLYENYSKLLGLEARTIRKFYSYYFNDKNIEGQFEELIFKKFFFFKIFIHIKYMFLTLLRTFSSTKSTGDFLNYINISFIIIWVILLSLYFTTKNNRWKYTFDILISYTIVIVQGLNALFSHFFLKTEQEDTFLELRSIYTMIVFSVSEIIFSIQYDFISCYVFLAINLIVTISVCVVKDDSSQKRYIEVIMAFSCILIAFTMRRIITIISRELFLQKFKFQKFFEYCDGMIKNIPGFLITYKNNKIIGYNNRLKKFIEDKLNEDNLNDDFFKDDYKDLKEGKKNKFCEDKNSLIKFEEKKRGNSFCFSKRRENNFLYSLEIFESKIYLK